MASETGQLGLVGVHIGDPLGQAEVHDHGFAAGRHHHVGRLQVAMDDALAVGVFQGQGDLADDLGGATLRHRDFRINLLFERRAGDVRHRDERPAVDLPGVEHGADVRMLQHGRRPGFADEPLGPLRRFRPVEERDFEGHLPAELGILRQVDRAHAAAAEQFQDAVTAELRGQDRKRIHVRRRLALFRVVFLGVEGWFHDEGLEAFGTPDRTAAVGVGHGTARLASGWALDEHGHGEPPARGSKALWSCGTEVALLSHAAF